jgi:NADPH-dependent 2,4-dienoyl-CoA reductase/sulfur reductase-like enzyme
VILGAGRSGTAAAAELRRSAFRGELLVLHDETVAPYHRPACAKGLLTGHDRPRDVDLELSGCRDVWWQLGESAVAVDAHDQVVTTDRGDEYEYSGLVVATGAHPVRPADWPVNQPGLHVLYGLSDALGLRRDLRAARHVVVVGAGMTGCEVASAVWSLGRECTLVDPAPEVLGRPLGPLLGGLLTDEFTRSGIDLRLGRRMARLSRSRRHWVVGLDDGSDVVTDVVVAAIGERPNVGSLDGLPGVDCTDGVLCDAALRVVGLPNAVAAGSVARWPNQRFSCTASRVSQWLAAWESGAGAARTLLAGRRATPVTLVPRFWSEQFGLRIQSCGILPPEAEVSITPSRPGHRNLARSGVAFSYHVDGELVGLAAVNAPRLFTTLTRFLLSDPGSVDRRSVSDQRRVPGRSGLAAVV